MRPASSSNPVLRGARLTLRDRAAIFGCVLAISGLSGCAGTPQDGPEAFSVEFVTRFNSEKQEWSGVPVPENGTPAEDAFLILYMTSLFPEGFAPDQPTALDEMYPPGCFSPEECRNMTPADDYFFHPTEYNERWWFPLGSDGGAQIWLDRPMSVHILLTGPDPPTRVYSEEYEKWCDRVVNDQELVEPENEASGGTVVTLRPDVGVHLNFSYGCDNWHSA